MFIQACSDISSTWSRRLQTIYWDASTTLPEQVILNLRRIQESEGDSETCHCLGLEHLCIDYSEITNEESHRKLNEDNELDSEHARRMTFFGE